MNKIKFMTIDAKNIFNALTSCHSIEQIRNYFKAKGLPADIKLLSSTVDKEKQQITFKVTHPSFEEISEGQPIPEIKLGI